MTKFVDMGPCGLCGGPDAGHRVRDAIADRFHAGDDLESLSEDYGVTVTEAAELVRISEEENPRVRVLMCGSRDWSDGEAIRRDSDWLVDEHGFRLTVIHGAAKGADSIAAKLADEADLSVVAFPADWKTHGKAAGPIRNQRMINEGCPDLVYAYMTTPNSRGTQDMVRRARKAGIPVTVVTPDESYPPEYTGPGPKGL